MIASLPMYEWPQTRAAHDRFWTLIRQELGHGPATLTRDADPWDHWQAPDLVLSQTCGLPYRARLHGQVTLIGTPDYGLDDCAPGYYRSVFVARRDDPRQRPEDFHAAVFAYNDPLSQSGWAAASQWAAAAGFNFHRLHHSGGHRASARAVAEGRADWAAIDAQSWRMILRHEEAAQNLQVIAATSPSPGLPLICAKGRDGTAIFEAVTRAIAQLLPQDQEALALRGLIRILPKAYLELPLPPAAQANT